MRDQAGPVKHIGTQSSVTEARSRPEDRTMRSRPEDRTTDVSLVKIQASFYSTEQNVLFLLNVTPNSINL